MNLKEDIEVIDEILASDNRAIRSTMSRNDPQSALQVLTVYGTVSGISFAQKQVHINMNEIPVLQEIIKYLTIERKIIIADYVIVLKGNQRCTYENAKLFLGDSKNEDLIETLVALPEKGHGQLEQQYALMLTRGYSHLQDYKKLMKRS